METFVIYTAPLSFSDKVYKGTIPSFSIQIRIRVRNIIMRKSYFTFQNPSGVSSYFLPYFLLCPHKIVIIYKIKQHFTRRVVTVKLSCHIYEFTCPLQGTIFQIPTIKHKKRQYCKSILIKCGIKAVG